MGESSKKKKRGPFKPGKSCKLCQGPIMFDRHANDNFCSKKCELASDIELELPDPTKPLPSPYHQNINIESRLAAVVNKVIASTAWRPDPLEETIKIVTGYPTLVVNDLHTPIHDPKWTEQALRAADRFECKTLVIAGDLIDANTISRFSGLEYRRRAEMEGDLASAEALLKIFDGIFDKIYYTLGNHSQRLISKLGGEVTLQRLFKMIHSSDKFKVTEKHYLILNQNTRILHPRSYSRIRGKLTADFAQRYQCHLITGHHHHYASTISADGKWQVVENGCLAQVDQFSYAEYAMHGMPEMCNGFAIALPESEKNKIIPFSKFSPWKHFGLPDLFA